MAVEYVASVLKAGNVKGLNKLILLAYANYADADGYSHSGEQRIADDCGVSRSTVRRAKEWAAEQGILVSVLRKDHNTEEPASNLTWINVAKLKETQQPRVKCDDSLPRETAARKTKFEGEKFTGDAVASPLAEKGEAVISGEALRVTQAWTDARKVLGIKTTQSQRSKLTEDVQTLLESGEDPAELTEAVKHMAAADETFVLLSLHLPHYRKGSPILRRPKVGAGSDSSGTSGLAPGGPNTTIVELERRVAEQDRDIRACGACNGAGFTEISPGRFDWCGHGEEGLYTKLEGLRASLAPEDSREWEWDPVQEPDGESGT